MENEKFKVHIQEKVKHYLSLKLKAQEKIRYCLNLKDHGGRYYLGIRDYERIYKKLINMNIINNLKVSCKIKLSEISKFSIINELKTKVNLNIVNVLRFTNSLINDVKINAQMDINRVQLYSLGDWDNYSLLDMDNKTLNELDIKKDID